MIVTGAAHGLGLAIARRFCSAGARVLMVDCDKVVAQRPGEDQLPQDRAYALIKDLADRDCGAVIMSAARHRMGGADVLVNDAAWSFHKALLEVSVEEFDRVVAINQRAPFLLVQEFARQVVSAKEKLQDPVIINIASVNALAGNPNLVPYAGTKGALVAMTRSMAVEFSEYGIRVNSLSPGAVETFVTKGLVASGVIDPPKLFQDYLVKRFASCEEIAELVAYLCGPAATYVTGANWVIDGGYLAR